MDKDLLDSPDLTPDDLPLWMRQAHRRVDWGMVLALVLGLLSVWPFVTRGGLPHGTALELYVHRTAEMADVLRDGVLYPRWAPHLLYGYGLPLFNYVAPGSIYLATLFQLLTESSAVDGVRFVLVLGAVVGAVGMYSFVRRRWGAAAGLVATGAYTLSPSLLFSLPYVCGELPVLFGLQLLPVVLWVLDRVMYEGRAVGLPVLAGASALLLLADERASPWMLLFVLGWLLWLGGFDRRPAHWWAWVGLALGVGLAAIFWFPALAERHLVHGLPFSHAEPQPRLGLAELLAPSVAVDFGAFNPGVPRNLGLVTWLFALGAAAATLARFRRGAAGPPDWSWLYFALAAGGLAGWLLAGRASVLDTYLLLGLAAFPLAVAAARVTVWLGALGAGWPRRLGLALMVGLPVLGAMPVLHPPDWAADFGETDAAAHLQLELAQYSLATVPPGREVPLPSSALPVPSRPLVEAYFVGLAQRVDRSALASGQVDVLHHTATSEHLLIRAPEPMLLPLYISAFEGWQAEVDASRVELDVAEDTGLLQVPVPSGAHDVWVYFGETPARVTGWGISLVSLGLAVLAALRRHQQGEVHAPSSLPLLAPEEARTAATTLGVLLLSLPLLLGSPGLFWRESPRGVILEGGVPLQRYTQGGVDFLAYSIAGMAYGPRGEIDLTLYWRAVRQPVDNFQVTVSLTDAADGERVVQSYKRHVGGYPTTRWPLDRYVRDRHILALPTDIEPGDYLLSVELWRCSASALGACQPQRRMEFFGERGAPLGRALVLPLLVTVHP